MAIAKKITIKPCGDNKNFPNNFMKYESVEEIELIEGENWFYIDTTVFSFTLAYLYMVTLCNVDIAFEINRSSCIENEDTNYAVPIPGATSNLPTSFPDIACADFSISLFGADRIWIKATVAGVQGKTNLIQKLYLTIKK